MRCCCCCLALTQSRHNLSWERPETMTVMMLMVLIKHLYFRYCAMCSTQMVTFDSHNNRRVIGFQFYT